MCFGLRVSSRSNINTGSLTYEITPAAVRL